MLWTKMKIEAVTTALFFTPIFIIRKFKLSTVFKSKKFLSLSSLKLLLNWKIFLTEKLSEWEESKLLKFSHF